MGSSHGTTTLFDDELEAGVDARKNGGLLKAVPRNARRDRVMAIAARYFHVFGEWADD